MDSPNAPQSLQNAGENNIDTNGDVNKILSSSDVVTVDLDTYFEQNDRVWVKLKTLCPQLSQHDRLDQLKVFKQIKEIDFSNYIEEEQFWEYIFKQYTNVTQQFSYVSIIEAINSRFIIAFFSKHYQFQLQREIYYQMHAVCMLAKYTNFQCNRLIKYGFNKDQVQVFGVRDHILKLMDTLLSKCLTQKIMVLLKTDMVPENAFLVLQLCEKLRDEIFKTLKMPSEVHISLLNAVLLLLNLWRHLMFHPNDKENFFKSTASALVDLDAHRTRLLLDKDYTLFYKTFSQNFKKMSAR